MTTPHPPGHLTDRDFRSDEEKWHYLERAPELDKNEPSVAMLAGNLWQAARGNVRVFAELAHAFSRDAVRYMTDTEQFGEEDIAPAGKLGDVLDRLVDDCDAKARLFVALSRAVRLDARMVAHWRGPVLAHVSAMIKIDGKETPVELTLSRARLGDDPINVPKEVGSTRWSLNEARI